MDETKLSEQEKTETFKDESKMPPGEAQNLECNRSLPTSGGLMADVPCLDRSLDGC